jgi:hypothetical protein
LPKDVIYYLTASRVYRSNTGGIHDRESREHIRV